MKLPDDVTDLADDELMHYLDHLQVWLADAREGRRCPPGHTHGYTSGGAHVCVHGGCVVALLNQMLMEDYGSAVEDAATNPTEYSPLPWEDLD